jgi:hypothetical protein
MRLILDVRCYGHYSYTRDSSTLPPNDVEAASCPSSTYSAFHSLSPTRAVTGPVEIHAFST